MTTTSYRTKKIYWHNDEQYQREMNWFCAQGYLVLGVKSATPDCTTTAQCTEVYYEYTL